MAAAPGRKRRWPPRQVRLFARRKRERLIDDGPARRIHKARRALHEAKLGHSDKATRAAAEHQVNASDVGLPKNLLLGHQDRACRSRAFRSEVLAPGDEIHVEGIADPSHGTADIAEAEKSQRPATEVFANGLLPTSLGHEMTDIRKDQRPSQLDLGAWQITASQVSIRDLYSVGGCSTGSARALLVIW
jgi:hypothetical protein